jgi:transposase
MNPGRRIEIPNAVMVQAHLAEELDPAVRLRLTLLNLIIELPQTVTLEEICRGMNIPMSTAYVWTRAWKTRGYAGILRPTEGGGGPPGPPPALSDADLIELECALLKRDHWDTKEVRELIAEHWGVELSPIQVWRILRHKLQMHYSKPYPHDAHRPDDAEEQLEARLMEVYNTLMDKGLTEQDIALGFLDEASPQLTANTARTWHFGRAGICKNTAKLKANAIGFYALAGHSANTFLDDSSQGAIVGFLHDIRAANPNYAAIVVVLDNFSSHRATAVHDAAEALGIVLVHLPPYSPDLNPIEFIWKSIKRVISRTFIGSRDELKQCITSKWNLDAVHHSFAKHWIEEFVPSIIAYDRS